jgi:hypothetical protein
MSSTCIEPSRAPLAALTIFDPLRHQTRSHRLYGL